jgi:hypothetical protein
MITGATAPAMSRSTLVADVIDDPNNPISPNTVSDTGMIAVALRLNSMDMDHNLLSVGLRRPHGAKEARFLAPALLQRLTRRLGP